MSKPDYKNLSAIFLNCSLKSSSENSHTQGLMEVSIQIMEKEGIAVECIHVADYYLAPGVQPDMTKEGFDKDDWPDLFDKIIASDIIVIGTPIWLGAQSSICTRLIERMYAMSGKTNAAGQYIYYGKVGGCVITGNEDGVKHVAMSLLYSLQHLGCTIPPQADCGWLGPIGPGPSYLDEDSGGPENEFTNKNTTFMTYNLLHMAHILKEAGGIPAYGNQKEAWEDGERWAFENPEYR